MVVWVAEVAVGLAGCGPEDLLDGTWLQTGAGLQAGDHAYELVLGQYGADVAGLVREHRVVSPSAAGLPSLGPERYCRPIQGGRYLSDELSFQFQGPDGRSRGFSLRLEDKDRLVGTMWAEGGEGTSLELQRVSDTVDKSCDWVDELVATAVLDLPKEELEALVSPMAAVVFVGQDSGDPCVVVGGETVDVPMDGARVFSVGVDRRPESCLVVRELDRVTLGWGVFVVFDDTNGNRAWDRSPLPGGEQEPLVGVARGHALLYLEGDTSFVRTEPEGLLQGFTQQSYSLVEVSMGEEGVTGITRVSDARLAGVTVMIQSATRDPRPAPFPRVRGSEGER